MPKPPTKRNGKAKRRRSAAAKPAADDPHGNRDVPIRYDDNEFGAVQSFGRDALKTLVGESLLAEDELPAALGYSQEVTLDCLEGRRPVPLSVAHHILLFAERLPESERTRRTAIIGYIANILFGSSSTSRMDKVQPRRRHQPLSSTPKGTRE